LTKAIIVVLLAVHGILAVWALAGFVEWFWATPPWNRISNVLFPRDILFMQWSLSLAGAAIFLIGYAIGWRFMPVALASAYAAMAALCAVQTFAYMESEHRFLALGLEYVAYAAILTFLFRTRIPPVHELMPGGAA
jgi:hypothetical protein